MVMESQLKEPLMGLEYLLNLIEAEGGEGSVKLKARFDEARARIAHMRELAEKHEQLLNSQSGNSGD